MIPVVPASMRYAVEQFGYAPAMRAGDFLFVAGQLGRDDNQQVIADAEAQFKRAWENVGTILRDAGATIQDIVDVVTFHVGLREHLALYKQVRDRVMQGHAPPWTAIGVSELSRPGLLVEIKVTAWLGARNA
ncbi:MAG TPA: RidA family protein [Acetobacteraceae bacterium]|nr:RidA family protein [Acetobacteraceae bacterium]